MKITYIYPPLFKPFYPMATRMITENLLRDRNLEVEFSDIPVKTYSSKVHKKIYDHIMTKAISIYSPNILLFLNQKYMVNNIFYVFMTHGYYNDYIFDEFESEFIVMTCINFCDLIIVRHLLEQKKKVVLGGPLINIRLSPHFIRTLLNSMGLDQEILKENLIIITGNIDLSTDLHGIIKNWKDISITENNYGTLYDCDRDFLQSFYDDSTMIPVHTGFNNRCWYGKCKFCTYKKLPKMDFLKDVEESRVINYFHNIMGKFNSNHIRFIDSYYNAHTPRIQHILDEIKKYHITIYTGILLLKNKEYIDFINKYVNVLLIGLESTSDFSLDSVNKGYNFEDIKEAVNNISKYLNKKIYLEISVILDLPCKDKDDVKRNYRNISEIQQRLMNEGFNVGVHMNILSVFPNMELLYAKNNLLERSSEKDDLSISSGKNYLIHLLRQAGMDAPLLLPPGSLLLDDYYSRDLYYGYISSDVPIVRYDVHGNVLPSDMDLMDEDIMRDILSTRPKKL